MPENMLTKLEELVLLAVVMLKDNAYGITIYKHLKQVTGKKMSVGSVYFPLERLTRRGYLVAHKGEPTPKRGGMSKRYYSIAPKGAAALEETKRINEAMWAAYDGLDDPVAGM